MPRSDTWAIPAGHQTELPELEGVFAWSNGQDVFVVHNQQLDKAVVQRSSTLSALHDTPGTVAPVPFAAIQVSSWVQQAAAGASDLVTSHDDVSIDAWTKGLEDLQVRTC